MRPVLVALLLVVLPLALCRAQDVGKVTGVVKDRTTAAPLAGAQVTVVGTRLVAVTDAAGGFALDGIPVGTVTLRARTIGYGSGEQAVSVATGEATTADFELQPELTRAAVVRAAKPAAAAKAKPAKKAGKSRK